MQPKYGDELVRHRKENSVNAKNTLFTLDEVFPDIFDDESKLVLGSLAKIVGLEPQQLAVLIGVHSSQVYKNQVKKDNDSVEKLTKLVTTLTTAARSRSDVKNNEEVRLKVMRWFSTPNPAFGMETPAAVLRAGKMRKLQSYADKLLDVSAS